MQKKSFEEINEIYDLEIERIVKTILKQRAKRVLLQFPEGMKPYSTVITDEISSKSKADIFIWMGTCFGACDVPLEVERLGVDLIVQFGHSSWNFGKEKKIKIIE